LCANYSPLSFTDAYVQAFSSLDEVSSLTLYDQATKQEENFLQHVLKYRTSDLTTNDGELAAFVAYACAFPHNCLCLVDTYDTITSGLQNFILVGKALDDFGYKPRGVRLDSGDLAQLSAQCQEAFQNVIEKEPHRKDAFSNLTVVASNDINEKILIELSKQKHGITSYGIGTNLVTCQAQPALGCVSFENQYYSCFALHFTSLRFVLCFFSDDFFLCIVLR
jgi:nicotinate phosphoribosyltransferase